MAVPLLWSLAVSAAVAPWVPGTGVQPVLAPIPAGQPFTFVVLGDNRGEANGKLRAVFVEMLDAIRAESPVFILQTGDMISGYETEEGPLRRQWAAYVDGVKASGLLVFHSPGNHDIFDGTSARVYRELWGPTWYDFDYGDARFIALDTSTLSNRLGEAQEAWLASRLDSAAGKRVFVLFHSPLFPVDGHRGSSLDKYPADRDRLHALFVKYQDRIKGVYSGHEHVYNHQMRDGVSYYITGGAGAPLYAKPEAGGFNHCLIVRVTATGVMTELRKFGGKAAKPADLPAPKKPVAAAAR